MTAPAAKKVASKTVAKREYTPKHSEKGVVTPRKSASGKHYAPGQPDRDTKQLISFAAGNTKNAVKTSFDNPMAPAQKVQKSVVHYRHILAAEFWIGLIAIITDRAPGNDAYRSQSNIVVQLAAFILAFAVLFAIAGAGPSAAKLAAALGGLIITAMVMQQEYFRSQNNIGPRFGALPQNIVGQPEPGNTGVTGNVGRNRGM